MSNSAKEKIIKISESAKEFTDKAKSKVAEKKDQILEKMDQNGDGVFDLTDVLIMAIKTPGVRITRSVFLKNEFYKELPQEVITKAIETTPAEAGISSELIDKKAEDVIAFERNCVSGISAALGIPGGAAMAATIPADIIQYYGYMLRAAQKLMYLYGFPEIMSDENELMLDHETMNSLTLCLGVMYGVQGANQAIKAAAKALAVGVEKKLLNTALTKGAIYPVVKNIAKWFGVKMTKSVFAGFFKKAIPVVGGVVGGGITFISFKPCCDRLKDVLCDTYLSNPNHVSSEEENKIFEDIVDGNESPEEDDENTAIDSEEDLSENNEIQ